MQESDVLLVSELSRLGRNLMAVMSILHTCMEKKEEQIRELLSKKVSYSAIGRIMGVNRVTVKQFAESRRLG